ncbi:polysaccharide biosynthesis/export family protein [Edaphobacter modestus]|nr:polysaccharide biosynthesis/export family protein [Edaphobacter modestus]
MKWFYVGVLVAMLSASGRGQDSVKKPETPAGGQGSGTAQSSASPQATAPTGPATLTGAPAVDNARYVIGPDDSLAITVWKEPSLSGTIPVRPDGMISIALVGDLRAAGRTPMQLADDITVKLKKYIQDPNVSVVVMADTSQRIFLIGEVGHVGPIPITPGMTPLQAIAAGGGLSAFANSKKIYILRNEGGKQLKIPFNYKQALKGEGSQDITLKPGDTIVVP